MTGPIRQVATAAAGAKDSSYENLLLVILGLTVGCVTIDRLAINFLAPYIMKDLALTNTALGLLSSALSVAWAIAGYTLGKYADASGRRKGFLLAAVIVFSLSSALSGLASSFATLAAARVVIGFSEGPIIPIGQTMMALESSPHRRGFNMGFTQNFCAAVLACFLGPIVLTRIADAHGWRAAFFLTGLPGLALAGCIALFLRNSGADVGGAHALLAPSGAAAAAAGTRSRNLWICGLLAAVMGSWLIVQNAFLPLYLVQVVHFAPAKMGLIMGVVGAGSVAGSLALPALSDRIGRKPVMLVAGLLAIIAPLTVMYLHGSLASLVTGLFVGWLSVGCIPIYMSTIPAETVSGARIAGTVGLIMGASEIVGGTIAPPAAGWAGDHFGLAAPFWIATAMAILLCLLSLFLRETAPAKAR